MPGGILIVEDDPALALALRKFLVSHGFEIAGCVGSVKSALAVIDEHGCDIAVLDVNSRRESLVPVAKILRQRGRPIVSISTYDRSELPAVFANFPFLLKPFNPNELVAVLYKSLERRTVA